MKGKAILQLALFACLTFPACKDKNEEPKPPTTENDKIEISINPSIVEGRATDYGFDTGDCVGLYVVNYNNGTPGVLSDFGNHVDNMRFTYNGSWNPDTPIYWLDNSTHADFYLYYPYNSNVSSVSAYPFSIAADQSTETAFKASDFLSARATNLSPTAQAINLAASHVMSRITIKLAAGNGFTAEKLAQANIAVKIHAIKTKAEVNLATGAVTATGGAVAVTPFRTDGVYKAIIVPQTIAEGDFITVTVNGQDYIFKKAFTFESGKNHQFTITINKTSNGVNVNINPWADDGTDNGGVAE